MFRACKHAGRCALLGLQWLVDWFWIAWLVLVDKFMAVEVPPYDRCADRDRRVQQPQESMPFFEEWGE